MGLLIIRQHSSPKVVEEDASNQQQIQPETGTKNYQKLVKKNEGRIGGKPDADKVSSVDDLNRLDIMEIIRRFYSTDLIFSFFISFSSENQKNRHPS